MAITAAQLNIILKAEGASKVKGDLKDVGQAVENTDRGFGRIKAGALGFGMAMIPAMGLGLKSAMDLEQGMADLNATFGGLDPSQFDALSTSIQQIGADSQYSATQVAGISDELAKSGFTVEDMLGGATKAVVDLAQATGTDLGTAVSGISAAMNIWDPAIVGVETGLTDAAQAADIFTVAANASSADVGDIIAGMRNLGPTAGQMGIGFNEAAAAIALMTNYGLKGADAGVSLARGLTNLADPTSEAATLMGDLGIAAFDAHGEFVGFPSLFNQLQSSMGDMSDQTKLTALSTIFGAEAADAMALAVAAGEDPLLAIIDAMNGSGQAAEQSALRMDTLGAQFDTLKEGVTTFLGSLVQGLIPGMRLFVDGANDVVDILMKIPKPIKTVVGAVFGLLAGFAAVNAAIKGFAALNALTGGAGLGIGLGGLIPTVLGVAAVAGVAYAAWKTNFLGMQDIGKNVFGGITNFVDNLKDAWDDLGATWGKGNAVIDRWSGIAQQAATYTNNLSRGLGAIAIALRGISGDNTPQWIVSLARGFDQAAVAVDGFLQRFNAAQTLTGKIGVVVDAVLSVGSWLIGQIPNVWAWLRDTAIPAMGAAAVGLGDVLVNMGQWVNGNVTGLWQKFKVWAMGGLEGDGTGGATGPGGANQAISLGDVMVNMGQWLRGTIPDVATKIVGWITPVVAKLSKVTLDVLDWGITSGFPTVRDAFNYAMEQALGNTVVYTVDVVFELTKPEVRSDIHPVDAIKNGLTSKGGFYAVAGGLVLASAITVGLPFTLTVGAIAGGVALGWKLSEWTADYFVDNPQDAVDVAIKINAILENTGIADAYRTVRGWFDTVEGWFDNPWPGGIDVSLPSITWPSWDMSWDSIPFVKSIKDAVLAVKNWLKDPFGGFDLSPSLPSITWPDISISMEDFPFYGSIKGAIDDFINWIKDPWPDSISIPAPNIGGLGGGNNESETGSLAKTREVWGVGKGSVGVRSNQGKPEQFGFNTSDMSGMAAPDTSGLTSQLTAQFTSAINAARDAAVPIATAAGTAVGAALSAGALAALPVFTTTMSAYTLQITTQQMVMTTSATATGLAIGVALSAGALVALPVFTTSIQAYTLQITNEGALMSAAGLMAGQQGGTGAAQGVLNALPTFAASVQAWTTVINGEAPVMAAAGLNAGAVAGFGASNGLDSAQGAIAVSVAAWPGIVNGIAGAMGGAGLNAGAAAGFGVANGIDMGYGAAVGAAARLANGVIAEMNRIIQPGSPSKVTTLIGQTIPAGLVVGMDGGLSDVARSSGRLASASIPSPYGAGAHGYSGHGYDAPPPSKRAAQAGDVHVHVTVDGNVYGVSDLTEKVMREMAPALASAKRQHDRSMGA